MMANLSLRGLDANVLVSIKTDARRRKISVNRAIIDILSRHFSPVDKTYDDLDALAGSWTRAEAAEFEKAIAPFGEVDKELWVAEPKVRYRVRAQKTAKSRLPAGRK